MRITHLEAVDHDVSRLLRANAEDQLVVAAELCSLRTFIRLAVPLHTTSGNANPVLPRPGVAHHDVARGVLRHHKRPDSSTAIDLWTP